jgi:hypothetical protein
MAVASKQQGFVLATTIWMIVILMLLGTLFHGYVDAQLQQGIAIKERAQRSLDLKSTEQTLLYLLMTRRVTRAGLTVMAESQRVAIDNDGFADLTATGNELRLDGSTYLGIGCARFSIQDRAGLVGLNAASMQGWLEGVVSATSTSMQVRPLMAALGDYVDPDDSRRIGGAEYGDYQRSGMPAPSNNFLRSDRELFAVFGWEEWLNDTNNKTWQEWLDIGRINKFNINTAPAGLLALLLDIGEDEAIELGKVRRRRPFQSLNEVAKELGRLNRWDDERFQFYSKESVRLELWCDHNSYSRVRGLQLTLQELFGPQQTDYFYRKNYVESKEHAEEILEVSGKLFTDALPVKSN